MRKYLETLIEEKGFDLDTELEVEGHIGLTCEMLIDFICTPDMAAYHKSIRDTLVKIDFHNGDVFHYLKHLAAGMVAACGY
jgi:hypothetical protein